MIKEMKPLTLGEARDLIETKGKSEEMKLYFKKFSKLKLKDVEGLKKELEALNNHKIREHHIAKIADFLPEDASDLNKIFTESSLDENEIKQVTDIVKKYK